MRIYEISFSGYELKILRKALQVVLMAHTVTETADSKEIRDTEIERLIRKIRAFEDEG